MAVEIACFAKRANDRRGAVNAFFRPGLGNLASVAIGGTSARSAAFTAGTTVVKLSLSDDCRIQFGDSTVVATSGSEPFTAGEHVSYLNGATHLAVIQP